MRKIWNDSVCICITVPHADCGVWRELVIFFIGKLYYPLLVCWNERVSERNLAQSEDDLVNIVWFIWIKMQKLDTHESYNFNFQPHYPCINPTLSRINFNRTNYVNQSFHYSFHSTWSFPFLEHTHTHTLCKVIIGLKLQRQSFRVNYCARCLCTTFCEASHQKAHNFNTTSIHPQSPHDTRQAEAIKPFREFKDTSP